MDKCHTLAPPRAEILKPALHHVAILCELAKLTYEEAFIGISYYTKELVRGYTNWAFTCEGIAADLASPSIQYLLLRLDDSFAGYAKLAEAKPPACLQGQEAICLERLYLLKAFQKKGAGALLLARAYEEAKGRGFHKLWLSVWQHNKAAISFYQKCGFKKVGEWDWNFESLGKKYSDRDDVMLIAL